MQNSRINIPKISDMIIRKIHKMIIRRELLPGSKLPSEQELMKLFSVPRPQIRAAFRKLELFGITRTRPQSGTYLANYKPVLLEGLLENILNTNGGHDPVSMSETRAILEVSASEYAAARRTNAHIDQLKKANALFTENSLHTRAVEDDIYFHMQVINASANKPLISAYLFLVPSLLDFWKSFDSISGTMEGRITQSIDEHKEIIQAIESGDQKASRQAMKNHLDNTYTYAMALYQQTAAGELHHTKGKK